MLASGLRGRGGAGFPTGMKWRFAQQQDDDVKYILCNADEGDPGAFMDRSVLEGDPHSLIEGMVIGAYAIGAHQGYVYVRAEYPLAVERLEHALGQARENGLLGDDIMGTGFDFDLEIRMGSGAFVCGEETALMTSIEGHRGEPRPRPPFPAVSGLWGKPSVLNNVETFANIAPIILKGAEWYASTGTETSKGTKVFALGGNVQHTGLVEVPIGMQLGELIYEVGGGIPGGKDFKAAQLGGPSGGCIPKQHLNVPVDYAYPAGPRRDHGLGRRHRHGRGHLHGRHRALLPRLHPGRELRQVPALPRGHQAHARDRRAHLRRRGRGGRHRASRSPSARPSARPRSAASARPPPTPCSRTIRHFRHEYEAHIKDHYCEAGVCAHAVQGALLQRVPRERQHPGLRVSLVGEQRYEEALRLHRERNPLASICARVCFHPCESKCMRAGLDGALAIRHVKRHMVEQETDPVLPEIIGDEDERQAQGRGRGLRPRRPLRRLLPRPAGLQAGRLRGRAQGRRHARPGHPGLPPAARGARARGRR